MKLDSTVAFSLEYIKYNFYELPVCVIEYVSSCDSHVTGSLQLVHEELVLQWLVLSGQNRDHAFAYSWFLFELIVSHHLSVSKCLN